MDRLQIHCFENILQNMRHLIDLVDWLVHHIEIVSCLYLFLKKREIGLTVVQEVLTCDI